MSAVCLKPLAILCLYWTALTEAEVRGVQWRESGKDITIQCKYSKDDEEYLSLRMGLNQEFQIFHKEGSIPPTVHPEYTRRLQSHGTFPNIDILIKGLYRNDTGVYWCLYTKYDASKNKVVTTQGDGSILLVVKESAENQGTVQDEVKVCGPQSQSLTVLCVVIIGAILLVVVTVFLICIIRKNRSGCVKRKPKRPASNDVYEEMRGAVRC
ncbi:unnamed protein product [Ophioblennius macclurei]